MLKRRRIRSKKDGFGALTVGVKNLKNIPTESVNCKMNIKKWTNTQCETKQ